MGLRRWLSWMLGDVLRQLTQSFEGGREDALVGCFDPFRPSF